MNTPNNWPPFLPRPTKRLPSITIRRGIVAHKLGSLPAMWLDVATVGRSPLVAESDLYNYLAHRVQDMQGLMNRHHQDGGFWLAVFLMMGYGADRLIGYDGFTHSLAEA